jgi:CheY-like chemotaxis protein
LERELGEILFYLIRMANRAGIDLIEATVDRVSHDGQYQLHSVPAVTSPKAAAVAAPGHTVRILIVEDERIVATDLQEAVNGLGYDAYAIASSGAEALAVARRERPDIVLMDIRIRGDADGIETAVQLRREFGSAIIFVTAHADDATVQRAKLAHPDAYLIKPVSAGTLMSTIEITAHRQRIAV